MRYAVRPGWLTGRPGPGGRASGSPLGRFGGSRLLGGGLPGVLAARAAFLARPGPGPAARRRPGPRPGHRGTGGALQPTLRRPTRLGTGLRTVIPDRRVGRRRRRRVGRGPTVGRPRPQGSRSRPAGRGKAADAGRAAGGAHLAWMRDRIGHRFLAGAVLHTGTHTSELGDRLIAAPLSTVWNPNPTPLQPNAPDLPTTRQPSPQRRKAIAPLSLHPRWRPDGANRRCSDVLRVGP